MPKKDAKAGEMTAAQFGVVAKLLRSHGPTRTAAQMVLVKGKTNPEAAEASGLSPQSVSNTLGRYRAAHRDIQKAYCDGA